MLKRALAIVLVGIGTASSGWAAVCTGPEGNAALGTGHSFLYSVSQAQILTDIVYPGSSSTTAYFTSCPSTP